MSQWGLFVAFLEISWQDEAETQLAQSVPLAILHFRLIVIRDIILTGFELELYSYDERPFAYWYLAKICDGQTRVSRKLAEIAPSSEVVKLMVFRNLTQLCSLDTPAARYLSTQAEYSSGLGTLAASLSHVLF